MLPLALLATLILLTSSVSAQVASPAPVEPVRINLDLDDAGVDLSQDPLPPAGTTWHELWPTYCRYHTQTGPIKDNGNGFLDACDEIPIDGKNYHIRWVGPTLFLDCSGIIVEPQGDPTTMNEPGTVYTEVHPNNGEEHVLIEYQPAAVPAQPQPVEGAAPAPFRPRQCDVLVFSNGMTCHVVRVSTDIIVVPK
ncbi:MAG: hypothetical protein D6773_04755 [Alphaproteobacteria bacterium]|nr:MAG: hypothetical protein D6773_04755 [Alphaproteobacteria bacterium]